MAETTTLRQVCFEDCRYPLSLLNQCIQADLGVFKYDTRPPARLGSAVGESIHSFFEHYFCTHYEMGSYTVLDEGDAEGHCGLCNCSGLRYKYIITLKPGDTGVEYAIDYGAKLVLPGLIEVGSDCINLNVVFRRIVAALHSECGVNECRIVNGHFDAWEVIRAYDRWEADAIALPLDWFYFAPTIRCKLMLGQVNQKWGLHGVGQKLNTRPNGTSPMVSFKKFYGKISRDTKVYTLFEGNMTKPEQNMLVNHPIISQRKYGDASFCAPGEGTVGYVCLEKRYMSALVRECRKYMADNYLDMWRTYEYGNI